MSFLYNNIAAIVVAAVASIVAWLFGGARGDLLLPVVPWLFALMVEVILCYPQRHHGETTYEARSRVWHELKRSKLVWISCGLLALLLIPFINNGLCTGCDAALIAQGHSPEPPFSFLPFCVDRLDHLNVVLWFMVVLPSVIAVHPCLTRRGKRLVIELIVWNGAALAVLGFVQGAMDAPGPFWQTLEGGKRSGDFFSSFGYPNMAGDYFVTLFGLAVALWRDRCEQLRREDAGKDPSELSGSDAKKRGRFWRRHYFLMPATVFFFAALNTLSRAAIILVAASALVYFAHTLVIILSRMRRSRRVFVGVWSLVVFGLVVFFATITMPNKMRKELNTLDTLGTLDRVTSRAQYHGTVAPAIWKDHPLFGVGGWGYAHFCTDKMKELNIPTRELQRVGGANVHNDHMQFLVEHGLVGFGAMVAIAILLLWPVVRQWYAMARDMRFKKGKDLPPKPVSIFVLPAPVLFSLLTAVCTVIHAFGDCPLRSCAVLDLFYISLAALPGFMPKVEYRHHH